MRRRRCGLRAKVEVNVFCERGVWMDTKREKERERLTVLVPEVGDAIVEPGADRASTDGGEDNGDEGGFEHHVCLDFCSDCYELNPMAIA